MAENNKPSTAAGVASFQPPPLLARSQKGPSHNNFKPTKKMADSSASVFVKWMEKGTEDINEIADEFIGPFRQQLQLQRLDSIAPHIRSIAQPCPLTQLVALTLRQLRPWRRQVSALRRRRPPPSSVRRCAPSCYFGMHDKTMLIGADSSHVTDRCIRVTIHHCFFDGTRQRHPRLRYGKVHLYNNYTRNWGIYAVCASVEAQILSQCNIYEAGQKKVVFKYMPEKS